ncbi:50S ribosomal protein L7ae [Candidatus Woesearchaeota archaeon]|nr:50S ribosomal protein L7ae [Candidatus Woesearchaeota archaeon]
MTDADKIYEAIEVARSTGKIKKGTNEVTKAMERGVATLVAYAGDVNPPEITMHLPLIAKEKDILCVEVPTKEELGAAAGLTVGTSAVAITKEGEAKKLIVELKKGAPKPEAKVEPVKEETPKEEPVEEEKAEEVKVEPDAKVEPKEEAKTKEDKK